MLRSRNLNPSAIKRIVFFQQRWIASCSSKRCVSSASEEVKKTALYDFHVAQGGKMVPFAGYLMPVQYASLSITASHLHTRKAASLFDVSHMLQSEVRGKDRIEFMESLVTGDISTLKPGQGSLTLFTTPEGGIIDDLIVSSTREGHLYVVSNAGCRDKDIPLLKGAESAFKAKGKDVTLVLRDDLSLVALQGPSAAKVLQPLVPKVDLASLYFMNTVATEVAGVAGCRVTRCGYTGEDGVEVSVPSDKIVTVVKALLESKDVELAGLGARDSLRLEAGLCLYGNDMDEGTTPPEAGLTWLVGKGRRGRRDFPGAELILGQIQDPSKMRKRRVGLSTREGPPPRGHMEVVDADGKPVGEVTSGCPSPSLAPLNIAMAYVKGDPGTMKLSVKVRNKSVPVEVVKMPFIKGKYFVPPKVQKS